MRLIPALNLDFCFDEAYTFFTRDHSFYRLIWFDPAHPPFFYWLMKAWSLIRTDTFFLRLPSLSFSFFSFILIFLIAKTIKFNKYFPILTVFFFSISVLNIEESFQLRMYALALFLMLLSLYSYLKILFKTKYSKLFLIIFCLANFLGILTDYSFIWYFLALFIANLSFLLFQKKIDFKKEVFFVKDGFFISTVLMILWLPFFVANFERASKIFYSPISMVNEIKGLFLSNCFESFKQESVLFFIVLAISIFSGIYLLYLSKKKQQEKIFVFWLIINLFFYIAIFCSLLTNLFFHHLVLPSKNLIIATFFPIFSFSGLISLCLTKKQIIFKISGFLVACFLITSIFYSLMNTYFYKEQTFYGKPSYKDAASFIRSNIDLSYERITFIPSWQSFLFKYYFLNYDNNQGMKKISYKTCEEALLFKENNFSCWLVNPNLVLQKTNKTFLSCFDNNQQFYYKKAYFFKCQF